jgi:uncharacterized protein YyaL (SSP411 family)
LFSASSASSFRPLTAVCREGGLLMNEKIDYSSVNALIRENSPYLLQHARQPVAWRPWGAEALAEAKKQDKPIFLSVGYSTCHWCHVMAHESFEDHETARLLNEYFISIKVDREERPDLDDIYMRVTHLLTGRGGWPNSVWLTPAGKPFFAGTYFPREDRSLGVGEQVIPGFKTILLRLNELWRSRRNDVEQSAAGLSQALLQFNDETEAPSAGKLRRGAISQSLAELRTSFDERHGGFGGAPKFPPHGALALLLYECRRTGDASLKRMALRTLDAMARGGLRDHLGGGFHRYSTDERWLLPHFEKMLYDNAQLLGAYAEAFAVSGDPEYKRLVGEIGEWLLRELTAPQGGFYSALDADSDGAEGRFYVWTQAEIVETLGEDEGTFFCHAYGVRREGNFRAEPDGDLTGANVLHLFRSHWTDLEQNEPTNADRRGRLLRALHKLALRRERRPRPRLDDKIITAWNGLTIRALARAGKLLGEAYWTAAADRAADFVLEQLQRRGRLQRCWRNGEAHGPAFLDDYVFLADALLELYETGREPRRLLEAERLTETMLSLFHNPLTGGFSYTAADHESLPFALKDPFDKEVPSAIAAAARLLLRLARLTGKRRFLRIAEETLRTHLWFIENPHLPAGAKSGFLLAVAEYFDDPLLTEMTAGKNGAEFCSASPEARSVLRPVTVEAFASRLKVAPGGWVKIAVRVEIEDGWHVNSNRPLQDYLFPTEVLGDEALGLRMEKPTYAEGKKSRFTFCPDPISIYTREAWIGFQLQVPKHAATGPLILAFSLRTQPCNERHCLAPQTHNLTIPVEVDSAAEADAIRHADLFAGVKTAG